MRKSNKALIFFPDTTLSLLLRSIKSLQDDFLVFQMLLVSRCLKHNLCALSFGALSMMFYFQRHLLLRLKTPFAFYLCTSEFTLLLRLPGTSGSNWLFQNCAYTKPEVIFPPVLKSLLLKSHSNIVYVSFIGGISHPFWNQVRNKEISPGQCGKLLCRNGMLWLPWLRNTESTCLPESGDEDT